MRKSIFILLLSIVLFFSFITISQASTDLAELLPCLYITANNEFVYLDASVFTDLQTRVDNAENYIYYGIYPYRNRLVFSDQPFVYFDGSNIKNANGQNYVIYTYDTNWNYTHSGTYLNHTASVYFGVNSSYYNHDIITSSGSVRNEAPNQDFSFCTMLNTTEDLASANFEYILINPRDWGTRQVNFVIRKCENVEGENGSYESQSLVFNAVLSNSSKYFKTVETETYYEIPQTDLNIDFQKDEKYLFTFEYSLFNETYYDERTVVVGQSGR